jgi:hypothetical protein
MAKDVALLAVIVLVARNVGLLVWAVRQAVAGAVPQTRP